MYCLTSRYMLRVKLLASGLLRAGRGGGEQIQNRYRDIHHHLSCRKIFRLFSVCSVSSTTYTLHYTLVTFPVPLAPQSICLSYRPDGRPSLAQEGIRRIASTRGGEGNH